LDIRDLHISLAGVPVLRGVTAAVMPGEILAITGASGSGKSTLLRAILGFVAAESGEITIGQGRLVKEPVADWHEKVEAVFQNSTIAAAATLRSHVTGLTKIGPDKVWQILQEVGMTNEVLAMPMGLQTIVDVDRISSGQMQRLLIARALARDPDLLVLDEAMSAIPDQLQSDILGTFRRRNLTTLLVTHRESAICEASRVLHLSGGKVAFDGPPAKALQDSAFTAMIADERQV